MALSEQFKKLDNKSYKGIWEKASGAVTYSHAPGIPVRELTSSIVQTFRSASAARDKDISRQAALKDVTRFLYEEHEDIDSCVRWAILHYAVAKQIEDDETADDNAPALLVQAITGREKNLAFEVLNTLRAECKSRQPGLGRASRVPDHSKFGKDLKENPFFHAVHTSRNTSAVQLMVHNLDLYCKEQVNFAPAKRRALLHRIPSSQDVNTRAHEDSDTARDLMLRVLHHRFRIVRANYTALELASQEEDEHNGKLGVLKVLLQCPGITDASFDKTFDDAMRDGKVRVIQEILEVPELRGKFVTSENITAAMDNINTVFEGDSDIPDIKSRRKQVFYELLQLSGQSVFDNQVAQKIIELNLEEAWETRPKDAQLDETCLLHIAVYHQHVNLVERFLKEYPASVSRKALVPGTKVTGNPSLKTGGKAGDEQLDQQGYYPLWYNRKRWEEGKWVDRGPYPNESIRQLLVPATIRQVEKMQRLSGIFRESEEQVDELCFEISQFNSKLYRVSEFVHSLINHQENAGLLWYEPTIKYARFPPLDVHIDDKEAFGRTAREEHTEVFDILDWLKLEKQVNSIIELKVPDRLVNPHNELLIAKYVDDFAIEILDWRFLDMALSVFPADTVKPRIRELHLYSSGKRAAISHWFSEEGLITFPNLRNIRIHVIQELMSKQHCDDTVEHINKNLGEFEIRWAAMRAEVERKAQEEKGKSDKEKKTEVEQEMQRAAESRKAQKAILTKLRRSGRTDLLKTGVTSQLWNPTHERLANLDELAQRAFPRISSFIRHYRNYVHPIPHIDSEDKDPEPSAGEPTKYQKRRRFRPTRVAIIDNGILSISPVPIETPLGPRVLERFNKSKSSARTNANAKTNKNDNNPRDKGRGSTRAAGSPLPPRVNSIATLAHQANGTDSARTSVLNATVNGGVLMHEGGLVASDKTNMPAGAAAAATAAAATAAAATAAAAHRETEDDDRRGSKGRNRVHGHGTLWSRIKEGMSFVDDDYRVSPWLFASDPHGSQMANLICSIDPACELYVAKVTDGNNFGISPERVIRAIEWAISRGVDIISMSFTMFEHGGRLEDVIQEAKKQGIVMMCSNHDEGANPKTAYPAAYCPNTWEVTACDEYGYTPREREPPKGPGRYMFQGLNIPAGVIPFIESNDRISGSSVATAIASGISSLILSCARLNTCDPKGNWHGESCPGGCMRSEACLAPGGSHDRRCPVLCGGVCVAQAKLCDGANRRHIVSYFLGLMTSERGKEEGYVLLERFGDIDAKVKEWEEVLADEVLRNWFSPGKLKEIIRLAVQANGVRDGLQ